MAFYGQMRRLQKVICFKKLKTCNAPMPAFPRVHMDGVAANALANAFLHIEKNQNIKKFRTIISKFKKEKEPEVEKKLIKSKFSEKAGT
ncbi:hypothetical protein HYC85_019983 [Camellia sinensis]|uniref:Uncharacterized protein n=1 Tax=Camellia sinensis TaxID=4442 RepID=A0A7J7GR03_CAMSI|nr:hypothetical protein HYC85_019983 [Camellia sinensis]